MSEKRFILKVDKTTFIIDKQENHRIRDMYRACDVLNEQQSTINHLKQELEEYKENWDDLVELATKTSLRNVELDEQIGRLQREN